MVELIIRTLQGRASAAQRELVRTWREADPENELCFQEIKEAWDAAGSWEAIDTSDEVPRAAELLGRLERAPEVSPTRTERRPDFPRRPRWPVPAAAAAILLLGLGLGYLATGDPTGEEPRVEVFRTGPEELRTVTLADGTVLRLAPGTTLEARITNDARTLRLDGRAFFAVADDPARTLTVRTSRGEARVIGTRFELNSAADGFRLLVVEGRVILAADGGETELRAGQMAHDAGGNALTVAGVEAPEALLGWMGSWMAFEDTPLSQVARELEARLGIRVEIVEPSITNRTISGWIHEEDPDEMIQMICSVADVGCTKDGAVLRMGS